MRKVELEVVRHTPNNVILVSMDKLQRCQIGRFVIGYTPMCDDEVGCRGFNFIQLLPSTLQRYTVQLPPYALAAGSFYCNKTITTE